MAAMNRMTAFAMAVLLTVFGAVLAQDDAQNQEQQNQDVQVEARTVGGEEFTPVGEAHVSEPEPFDTATETAEVEVERGAIIFTATTPGDQHPNVDLVGPDNYFNHFDVGDNPDEQFVLDDLLPGIYSVAATDDDLQLVHTLVEVVAGQAVRVDLNLGRFAADFVPGAFAPTAGNRAFPAGGFRAGTARPIDDARFGAVAVETNNEDARFVITGPDEYSREFTGSFVADGLTPGVYVIAGTADGAEIATTAVEVEVSTEQTMVPAFTVTAETEEVEGDVAGGGEAEDDQDQTDQTDGEQEEGQQD